MEDMLCVCVRQKCAHTRRKWGKCRP